MGVTRGEKLDPERGLCKEDRGVLEERRGGKNLSYETITYPKRSTQAVQWDEPVGRTTVFSAKRGDRKMKKGDYCRRLEISSKESNTHTTGRGKIL